MLIKHDKSALVEEFKDLSKGQTRDLVIGEQWYLIEKSWFEQYKKYINAVEKEEKSVETLHPGPIDNTGLLLNQIDSNECSLKPDLVENAQFVFMPPEHYSKIKLRFGIVKLCHEISRIVIETGTMLKQPQIEMNPLKLFLSRPAAKDVQKVQISRSASMASLCKAARQQLKITDDKEIRLYLQHKDMPNMELLQFTDEQALEELNLYTDQKLVIDWKKSDGSWHVSHNANDDAAPSVSFLPSKNTTVFGLSVGVSEPPKVSDNGLCGLTNLGNTCFMNSALQCMSNTPPLSQYFASGEFKNEVNDTNPLGMKGELAHAFGDLMKQMWSPKNTVANPRNFKYTVGRFASQFSGYAQQDSQELLAFLLDGLHEDLNRVRKKPYIESKDYDGQCDTEAGDEAWHNYKLRNDSMIVDLFHGQLKSTLVCPVCSKRSVTFDPFCYLSLPLSIKRDRNVLVTVVPLKVESPIIQCQVIVPEKGSIKDLAQGLSRLIGVSAQQLILAEISMNRFLKFYAPDDDISFIPDRELTAYEIPESTQAVDRPISLKIYNRIAKKPNNFSSSSLVGLPMLLMLNRNELSYNSLRTKVISVMNRFVDLNDPSLQNEDESDSGVEENGDVAMDDQSREVATVSVDPFRLILTNSNGSSEISSIQATSNDQPLTMYVGDELYVCLEWKPVFERFFSHEMAIEQHESTYANKVTKKCIRLNECLDLFTTNERLGKHDLWYCPQCKHHQQATKKFDLWKVPEILIIHLKRFSYDSYYRRKIETLVDFPLENLNVKPWIVDDRAQNSCYDLIAVSNHYGGLCGGHYTAYAKNYSSTKWHLFDDSRVSNAESAEVVSKAAYVLVYAKRHGKSPNQNVTDPNVDMEDEDCDSDA